MRQTKGHFPICSADLTGCVTRAMSVPLTTSTGGAAGTHTLASGERIRLAARALSLSLSLCVLGMVKKEERRKRVGGCERGGAYNAV